MNEKRRKTIRTISQELTIVTEKIRILLEEEEEYRDNIPDNLQGSERYEKADNACNVLEDVADNLDDIIDSIIEL